jgi:hypothetical protein
MLIFFYTNRMQARCPPTRNGDNGRKDREETSMKKRNGLDAIWCLCLMGMLSFLWACSPSMDTQASHESKTMEADMNLAHNMETESPAIPAIDAAAPTLVETASFGLG